MLSSLRICWWHATLGRAHQNAEHRGLRSAPPRERPNRFTWSVTHMSCPFHQTKFVDHEVFIASRFVTTGLPIKDNYDHFHCQQCFSQTNNAEWVIIANEYYQYQHKNGGRWHHIHRMPEHPRKGKYIGTKVYQPWNVHIASKNFQCNVQRCWMKITFVLACPTTGSVLTRAGLTATATVEVLHHILATASCFCPPPHIIIKWVLGFSWSPAERRNIKEN